MKKLLTTALILNAGLALAEPVSITADIWADNWFEMSVNGEKVVEDSVPITTERSFNKETVTFDAEFPMTIAFTAKDFKENDTGLEYIGSNRQQMGDGGLIAQFHNADGELLAVTNSDFKCIVIHHAPVEKSCAKEDSPVAGEGACDFVATDAPADWASADFDDSEWPAAFEHSVESVSPKKGYDEVTWDASAQFIWGEDLHQDNTVLCRATIG